MDKFIKEGWESFYRKKVKYRNPYKPGSDEYNKFERGWVQALKRADKKHFTG